MTGELFRRFPTPAAMASASLEELEEAIKQVGLFRNKAKHLKELAIMLCEQYDGQVPDDFDELLRLPGIGRKSANVIMAVGWGRPGLGVDPRSSGCQPPGTVLRASPQPTGLS